MSGRGRRRQDENGEAESLTKEEDAIARFLRFNCPTKTGNCNGNDFSYFIGSKAVDTLLESKKYGAEAKEPKFKTKGDCEFFIRTLIDKGAVFRAKKVVLKKKTPEEKRKGKKEDKISATNSPRTKREKQLLKEEEEKRDESDSGTDARKDKDEESEEKKEKKKKVILVMQQNQSFSSDTSDVYAWVFDPTPWHKKVIGALMLVGVILGCLFPLWPDWLRLVIYYLSMSGIVFLLSIMGLAIARTILFGIIYAATFGKHHLWVLPNLTADCGFLESFKPFYTYEYISADDKKDKKKSKINSTKGENEKEETEALPEPKTSKPPSSNEDDEEENEGEEEEEVEHGSESSGEVVQQQSFETEGVTPEQNTNRRRRRPRREDESDFVMVNK
jgi:translocation protein SEC62